MIKKIIEKIKSWFRPKEEMEPHEVMLHPEKSDTPVYENEQDVVGETAKQKKIRPELVSPSPVAPPNIA